MALTNNIFSGNGTIDYARMLHLSNAFAFNQFSIGKLINLPWFINYPVNNGSGPSYDPDALDWFNRVESAGGTITNANKTAFNTAFLSLKSTQFNSVPLWNYVNQGYWLIGQESLTNGLMVPFYRSDVSGGSAVWGQNATNNNFTTYTKTGGIVGDGATTGITTTVNNNNQTNWPLIDASDGRMCYVYLSNTRNGDFQRKLHPFGTVSSAARSFSCILASLGETLDYRFSTNASTQSSGNLLPLSGQTGYDDGGYGLITNTRNFSTATLAIGTGKVRDVNLSTPSATNPTNTLMCIGRNSAYSACNIKCAILGKRFLYDVTDSEGNPTPLNQQAFYLIDTIVNTLVASLT